MGSEKDTNQMSGRDVGFTLTELLVVLAVISVLMAILLPALHQAHMFGKRLVCMHRLKQIAGVWQMYFDDNEGQFFRKVNAHFIYGGWKSTLYQVKERPLNAYFGLPKQPQTESEAEAFQCPSDMGDIGTAGLSTYSVRGTSYGTNIILIGQESIGRLDNNETQDLKDLRREINARLPNLHSDRVDSDTGLLLIGDMPGSMEWLTQYPHSDQHDWHGRQNKYNWAFMDGHVKFLKMEKGKFHTSQYTVIPFKELYPLAIKAQSPD